MLEFNVTVENVNGVLVTTSNRVANELGVNHRDLTEKNQIHILKDLGVPKELQGSIFLVITYILKINKHIEII